MSNWANDSQSFVFSSATSAETRSRDFPAYQWVVKETTLPVFFEPFSFFWRWWISWEMTPHLQLGRCWRDQKTTSNNQWVFHLHGGWCCSPFFFCIGVCNDVPIFPSKVSLLSLLQSNSSVFPVFPILNSWKAWFDEGLSQESSSDRDVCGSQTL